MRFLKINFLQSNLSKMHSQKELVEYLEHHKMFTKWKVRSALLAVDRADFAPTRPYDDIPRVIMLMKYILNSFFPFLREIKAFKNVI